ncbi:MAG: hypothetical protein BA865_11470 [Desulfobacterales bacterium S5133MH4]|nr:MAG: hypothetical protein BA865_11470 [Desulfobacterales bacterium S5133MH4]
MQERREYERFDLRLPGKIEVVVSGKQEIVDVLTSDISAGGAYFCATECIPDGTQVRIRLTIDSERLRELTGKQGLIDGEGIVVRSSAKWMAVSFDGKHNTLPLRGVELEPQKQVNYPGLSGKGKKGILDGFVLPTV